MSKIVFLAAGHGGNDSGAVAYGMREKDIVLVMMLACKEELERHGINVVCNRTTDVEVGLEEKCAIANKSGASIAVSFHINAAGGDGFEDYYYPSSKEGKRLAEHLAQAAVGMGQNLRDPYMKDGYWLYFVKHTTMPAVLVETAFIDNDEDNNIIDTEPEQKAFGVAYAHAILKYLGVDIKEQESSTKTEEKKKIYRLRKSWTDAKSQIGAFESLENAKKACKSGYKVFDGNGKVVYAAPAPAEDPKKTRIKTHQQWLKKRFGFELDADGIWGPVTTRESIRALQVLSGPESDGIWGPNTRRYCPCVGKGDKGDIVRLLQGVIARFGFVGVEQDGIFGDMTQSAVIALQRTFRLEADGLAGKNTWEKLLS